MTRRAPQTNGVHINGELPPPSTLAAQIVQNQSRPPATQQDAQAIFAGLINEILHNHDAVPETDISVNVKLVNVVAEAGLGPLTEDNPFARPDALLPQALDSLMVIEATIRRQPEVLFAPVSQDGPQLLLPLLAKLFAVCGRQGCETLPVKGVLEALLDCLDGSLDLWHLAKPVRQVIQDSAEDLLVGLDRSITAPVQIKLPPARSIATVWTQSGNAVALADGCQTTLTVLGHAFSVLCDLVDLKALPRVWKMDAQLRLAKLMPTLQPQMESAKTWRSSVQRLLQMNAALAFLVHLVDGLGKGGSDIDQATLATALIRTLRTDEQGVRQQLVGPLTSLASLEIFDELQEDIRIAVATIVCRCWHEDVWPQRIHALHEALRQDNVMTDSELQSSFQELSIPVRMKDRRSRRRNVRTHKDSPWQDRTQALKRVVSQHLCGSDTGDLSGAAEASEAHADMSEDSRCLVWNALAELAPLDTETILRIVYHLTESASFQNGKRSRILALAAVKECAERTHDEKYVHISNSALGQMCLKSLHSHVRELRITAGRCLSAFLRSDLPDQLRLHNRKIALEYLRVLSDRNVASEQETLVNAWAQVASICDGAELNLALLRLVDYLGHANPLICALAFTELERLCDASSQPEELFRPFWGTVAVTVVQDLQTRPQKAQQFCDLVGIPISQFLVLTQQETVPTLVLTKKRDVLQRLAAARGKDTPTQDVILNPRATLAATIALLLAQPVSKPEEAALACLEAVAPGFKESDMTSLVKADATLTGCYMLKAVAEQPDELKSRARQSFHLFANIAERRQGQGKSGSRSARLVGEYFETHRLGILTHFSEVLENPAVNHTPVEKIRCLKAIGEMINLDGESIAAALPQIRATLQSAMEQPLLREAAFDTWLLLLSALDDEHVGQIAAQSFALVLRHWDSLAPHVHQAIHASTADLINQHNQVIRDCIMTLPSLSGIPLLSKFGAEIDRLKSQESVERHCRAFALRLQDENRTVVFQALSEVASFLEDNSENIHDWATSEQPVPVLAELVRALLDVSTKYSAEASEAHINCGKALGIIGCLDPNRLEAPRKRRQLLMLSNFVQPEEVIDWAIVLLEDVLVKAFKAVTNARAQGYLAYTMQELLRFCEFKDSNVLRLRSSQTPSVQQKWLDMPEHVRITLTPFVTSRYVVSSNTTVKPPERSYPGFNPDQGYSTWLRGLVYDLMWKAKEDNAKMVFPLLARVMRGHDLAIPSFVLPYAILNVVIGGTKPEVDGIAAEFLAILGCQPNTPAQQDVVKLCSESVFHVLDYASNWLQQKRKILNEARAYAFRTGHSPKELDEAMEMGQIGSVETFLESIPAEMIAARAVMCGSYARALFHWEQYIRQKRVLIPSAQPFSDKLGDQGLYSKLQDIYAQIDEPDGFEGISAHLPLLNEAQEATRHVKAGRWTAAQAWYEVQLSERPRDVDVQEKLLGCLQETGKFAPLLRYADSFLQGFETHGGSTASSRLTPAAFEAQWVTGDLEGLQRRLTMSPTLPSAEFNVGIAKVLSALATSKDTSAAAQINDLRRDVSSTMTVASTGSVQASHEHLKKLHVLYELEKLTTLRAANREEVDEVLGTFDRRLIILGSYVSDKRYILGVRRAAMQALKTTFAGSDVGSAWLATARMARQAGNSENAYNEVLKAYGCGAKGAKLEEARLLWRDGHQRHAIRALDSAISSGIFEVDEAHVSVDESGRGAEMQLKQNMLSAKAHLLLAKWLDASGQSQSKDITDKYQYAARYFQKWEKGHYYLGKHYMKLLEAEKAQPEDMQDGKLAGGEYAKLVVENFLRSTPFGTKYWHQTIPKILTLWLELGMTTMQKDRKESQAIFEKRKHSLSACNKQLQKYFERVPAYVIYNAMPQMISRMTHPNNEVWKHLCSFLTRIVANHPNQALWSLFAVTKATDRVRVERGMEILHRLKDPKHKPKEMSGVDLRAMMQQGQRLSDGLLQACEQPVEPRNSHASLSRNLGFNHKLAPNPLVVPMEATLTASAPNGATLDTIRKHKAFAHEKITIQSFADDVLVLSSLQRPRKLTVRGSDGKQYGLLCKPKDDLRKDQRLMEFNGIINRALKRDAESSKRRLYIKTYAVTPLSEESGTIEWVEGIKPIRDILLNLYGRRNIRPNYQELKKLLEDASTDPSYSHIFNEKVLPQFPPVMHEWFTETYAEPDAWFAARLRYARTAAVMSMTGYILGLGDRHGENILLEESTGGVFHVDFNCLFDKGLTFEKPELVPFRLTHNMVDAMGPYGYEGPFRKSSELTLRLLRQSKDTLMTVLETFLYDPTTDFVGKKKRSTAGVPETPQEILDSVARKLKGLLRGESVPLSVEGHVDSLIREATSPWCLASMYIGWCSFL